MDLKHTYLPSRHNNAAPSTDNNDAAIAESDSNVVMGSIKMNEHQNFVNKFQSEFFCKDYYCYIKD
jgi:hypothetical protein